MSIFGTPSIQAAPAVAQAERVAARESEKKKVAKAGLGKGQGPRDEFVPTAMADDAVQGAGGKGQEETAAERNGPESHQPPPPPQPGAAARIDVQG